MSNNFNRKKRSNSFDFKTNAILGEVEKEDRLSKTKIFNKKKNLISYKNIQNIDLTTYDYLFNGREMHGITLQDFDSFKTLLNNIKKEFNPKLLQNNINFENIEKSGKFSFNNSNITELIILNDNENEKKNNIEISINNRYLKTNKNSFKNVNLYCTKSFFKGKHCFEIEILNFTAIDLVIGILNISKINFFRENLDSRNKLSDNLKNRNDLFSYKLKEPFFIKKNNIPYNHYLVYGDTLGFCFDLDKNIFYLFLNGELVFTEVLKLRLEQNDSFTPYIDLGRDNEIIFNPGDKLKYGNNYLDYGFVPLDETGQNNFELSNLKKITDDYLDILVNNAKLIGDKNITYSDINQIFHIIFDFLGKYSFKESYIIYNSIIKKYFLEKNKDKNIKLEDLEIYYFFLQFILNYSRKGKKTIVKIILLNIAETIHILLKKGHIEKNSILINNLFELLIFLLNQKDIQIILKSLSNSLINIFRSIFTSFNICKEYLIDNYIDFPLKQNIEQNNNNISDSIFSNIEEDIFEKININKNILEYSYQNLYLKLLESIYHNGTEGESKIIFKIFKKYLEKELEDNICVSFKNCYIPLLKSFNDKYKKGDKIVISIKKYLIKSEIDGEKIGGTVETVHEKFTKNIPNIEELLNYKINNPYNVFLLNFLSSYYINNYYMNNDFYLIWNEYKDLLKQLETVLKSFLLDKEKINNIESVHDTFIKYLNYRISYFNMNDLNIFIQFLYNIADFILNELYPKQLIYFLPDKILHKFSKIIDFIIEIQNLCDTWMLILSIIDCKKQDIEIKNVINEKLLLANNLKELCNKCCHQYLSIHIKIINDENIQNPEINCNCLDNLKKFLNIDEFFTNDDLFSIFNFLNSVHNKTEYKDSVISFAQIFDNNFNSVISPYYNLGKRLIVLLPKNLNFLRVIIILLYNRIDRKLTKLEEAFSEYNFIPRNSQILNNNLQNNFNPNIIYSSNNNIIVVNDRNFNNNQINRNNLEMINNAIDEGIPINGRRLIVISELENNDIIINDRNKLIKLENSLNDMKQEILKLNNFYGLTSKIKELYQNNTLENRKLYNLILSLNNLLFSKTNIDKIENNRNQNENNNRIDVINSYSELLKNVFEFYKTIITNIIEINDEDILKEISRQRNIINFKEMINIFEKYNPPKKEDDYKIIKDFIIKLEQLIPEEETLKQNTINESNESNNEQNNICLICSDATIDSHMTPCGHPICRNCLYQHLFENKLCPFCRVEIKGIQEDPNFKI